MNLKLQKSLSQLENMIGIQTNCLERGYMHGMLNGLICAYATISDSPPEFVSLPKRKPYHTNIRHKSRQRKAE